MHTPPATQYCINWDAALAKSIRSLQISIDLECESISMPPASLENNQINNSWVDNALGLLDIEIELLQIQYNQDM